MITGISRRTATRELAELTKKGIFILDGAGSGMTYSITSSKAP